MKQAQQNAAMGVGFTPGPWKITFSGSSAIVQDEMDCTVAECPSYGVGFTNGNQPAPWHLFRDNARLIASAPDLLFACQVMVDAWGSCECVQGHTPEHPCPWCQARKSIAKATGNQ